MPYLKQQDRDDLAQLKKLINDTRLVSGGSLNYLFYCLALEYIKQHGMNYQAIQDVEGAFTCCTNEFYRRIAAPYEDEKIKENGDVLVLFSNDEVV